MSWRAPVLLALLLCAAPAHAAHFVVTQHGDAPAVAVDDAAGAHVVWGALDAPTRASTTWYCRVPRHATSCAKGSAHAFTPVRGAQDFSHQPRVFVAGRTVTIVFSRCCKGTTAPDTVYETVSSNGGKTFSKPSQIGTLTADVDLVPMGSAFVALGSTDSGLGLQQLQPGATDNVLTNDVAESGGVGIVSQGVLVAYAARAGIVRTTVLTGDLATAKPAFTTLAHGSDIDMATGPKGAD